MVAAKRPWRIQRSTMREISSGKRNGAETADGGCESTRQPERARSRRRKGPDLLISAVKNLPKAIREKVVLMFLGSGPLAEALTDQAEELPAVKTVFLGFQNQRQLSRYYHAADMLVLPSRELETWGLVVNEALHHGLPCVVSDGVGSAPDLIKPGATGAVFETGSALSLTAALQQALTLIRRPEIRDACRRQVSGYTVERAAEGIERAYHSVVAEGVRFVA